MKKSLLKTWLTMLCLLVGVGSAWGEDATMTAGTNGSTATVNSKSAIKVGTSNKGGDMTITVPAGATSLEFYAAAWSGVTGLSLNITPAANVSPTSVSLTADTGISGNSPFTLAGTESSYKFTIALSNITEETTLTLTSSAAKRFVVWGATSTAVDNPSHTAHFYVNGAADSNNDVDVEEGSAITFPSDPEVDGVVFMGWTTAAIDGSQDQAPDFVEKSSTNMGNADVTYYAVFAHQEGEETTETFGWEEATTPSNWTIGGTITRTEANASYSANSGSYYGLTNSNSSVQFKNKVKVKSFSYNCVRRTTNTNTSIKIETSTNGTSWTEVLSTTWNTFNSDGKTYKKIEKTWDEPVECYVRVNLVTAAGRQLDDISITYGDVTYSDYCTSVASLTGIAVTTAPTKVLYKVGETYDDSGIVITATYANGNTRNVTASCTNNAEEPLTDGHKTITYTYNGETSTQEIDVVALDHITVTTAPAKTVYTEEEDFDAEGMVVEATWGTGDNTISETVEATVTDGENLAPGKTFVTLSYTHEGTTKTTTQAITVNAIPTYTLTITRPAEGGVLTVKDGETPLADGASVRVGTNLTCEVTDIPEGKRFSRFYFNYGEGQNKYKATNPATFDELPTEGFDAATVTVTYMDVPQYTINYMVNGVNTTAQENVYEGTALAFPTPETINGKSFVGWAEEAIDGTTNTAPSLVNIEGLSASANKTYYAVFANLTPGDATTVTDVLTRETTGIKDQTGSTSSYSEWNNKTVVSSAVYAGKTAGGNNAIQLRSTNNDSGIISTTTGGRVRKIEVVWQANTAEGRTLNVYGKHHAYASVSELYGSTPGTLLGTIKKGSSTTLNITNDYEYVAFASESGAMYLTSLSIDWENGTPDSYSDYCTTVAAPETSTTLTISQYGYATFYDETHAFVMPEDCEGYVFTGANGLELAYEPEEVVPAGEPLLIYTIEPGEKTLVYTTSEEETYKANSMNDLCGAATDINASEMAAANPGDNYFYALTLNSAGEANSIGFYWRKANGAAFDIAAGKAYLVLPASASAPSRFVFADDETAIKAVESTESGVMYNLSGLRVNDSYKGIVIKNGKKFFNK